MHYDMQWVTISAERTSDAGLRPSGRRSLRQYAVSDPQIQLHVNFNHNKILSCHRRPPEANVMPAAGCFNDTAKMRPNKVQVTSHTAGQASKVVADDLSEDLLSNT
jgi:hypothetical protein